MQEHNYTYLSSVKLQRPERSTTPTSPWSGQAFKSHKQSCNLNEKPLKLIFCTDKGAREKHSLSFYERNPAGRGLDFTENHDAKEDFIRCVVDLHCLNLVADTRKTPLPPLEDLAEGEIAELHSGVKNGSEYRKELDAALRIASIQLDWYRGTIILHVLRTCASTSISEPEELC